MIPPDGISQRDWTTILELGVGQGCIKRLRSNNTSMGVDELSGHLPGKDI
jgi:hypothetical protein